MTRPPPLALLAAAVVGFCAPGLYVAAWEVFVAQSSCRVLGRGDCMGAPIAMAAVGLPVLYAVWALGLAATRARFASLAPLLLGLVLFAAARVLSPYQTPVLLWLVLTALLTAGWRWRFGPLEPSGRLSPGR
ncbi:MAG: hypothetical protein WBQ50_02275 [Nocardioides sp.]